MVWAVIFGMGAIVFLNRYLFLEPRLPIRLGSNLRQFLGFAVPGMLTAICGPIVFMPEGRIDLGYDAGALYPQYPGEHAAGHGVLLPVQVVADLIDVSRCTSDGMISADSLLQGATNQ